MTGSTGLTGLAKTDIDTPALLVDLDIMDGNIARIASACQAASISWRPHIKGIKVPAIAHKTLAAGAIGVTCAKLGEAEVMAAAGLTDILIANQIVGPLKIARLAGLGRHANIMVLVDCVENVQALAAAARAAGIIQRVLIEVDIGQGRAGVKPGDDAVALARSIGEEAGIELAGVAGWEGHTSEIQDQNEKAAAILQAVGLLTSTASDLRDAGFNISIVSCGGTGTYKFTSKINGVTEIQAGGGILSDVLYRSQCNIDHPFALTIMSTVTSRPNSRRIICDAGKKAMTGDSALPVPLNLRGVRSVTLSAEHAKIELDIPDDTFTVGSKLEFVVGYSDTTVHMHENIFGIRNGRVEIVWPILGRGKFR